MIDIVTRLHIRGENENGEIIDNYGEYIDTKLVDGSPYYIVELESGEEVLVKPEMIMKF
jgi:hypothetical protein